MKTLRVLALGDVVGTPGKLACVKLIPQVRQAEKIDFVIANVENLASGSGITEAGVNELFENGVDAMTSGDHIFKKKEAEQILQKNKKIIRPANYPNSVPGLGSTLVETEQGVCVGIINVLGRVFLKTVECPFEAARREVEKLRRETPLIFVDIHAEATSEKAALTWFLDGKVTAVFGTHTHVQTADERIFPLGTGFISDLGMCGPYHSVIGRDIDQVLKMFLTQMPIRLDVATEDARISGAIFEINPQTGKTVSIRRIQERVEYAHV